MTEKILLNPQKFWLLLYKEKMLTDRAKLNSWNKSLVIQTPAQEFWNISGIVLSVSWLWEAIIFLNIHFLRNIIPEFLRTRVYLQCNDLHCTSLQSRFKTSYKIYIFTKWKYKILSIWVITVIIGLSLSSLFMFADTKIFYRWKII